MAKMSEYTNVDVATELNDDQKKYYKDHAVVTSLGKTSSSDNTLHNYNVHIPNVPDFPTLPTDSDEKTYVLAFKNGSIIWMEDTGSGSGSGASSGS
jgi:hypothetical protein